MQSLFYFIITPIDGKRYNNTKKIGGAELIISTSEEDFKSSQRFAKVVNVPVNYDGDIRIGDTLLVHHNVFKFYNDMHGVSRSGASFFRDNLFFVDGDQFFAYKRNGEWFAHDRFVIVKPIKNKNRGFSSGTYEPLRGEIFIANKYLTDKGIKKGDEVLFKPDSEYEFTIDDQLVYRMFDHQIVAWNPNQ